MHYISHEYDWGTLELEDCPQCGQPTLTGIFYGGKGSPIRLDAMPVRGYKTVVEPPCGYVSISEPVYTEHIC